MLKHIGPTSLKRLGQLILLRCLLRGWGWLARLLVRPDSLDRPVDLLIYDPLFTYQQGHSHALLLFFHKLSCAIPCSLAYIRSSDFNHLVRIARIPQTLGIRGSAITHGYKLLDQANTPLKISKLANTVREDLGALLKEHTVQCLCAPNATPWIVHGLCSWIKNTPAERRPRLIIGLLIWDRWIKYDRRCLLFKQLAANLNDLATQTRVHVYVETKHTRDILQRLCAEVVIHRFPYFAAARTQKDVDQFVDDDFSLPVFGLMGRFGVASIENPEVLTALRTSFDAPSNWVIQFKSRAGHDDESVEPQIERSPEKTVQWLGNDIDDQMYSGAFKTLSCVAMVFPKGQYDLDGSGIFYEAVLSRKILILPTDCGLLGELTDFSYPFITFKREQPGSLTDAIREVIAHHQSLRQQANTAKIPHAITDSARRFSELLTSLL